MNTNTNKDVNQNLAQLPAVGQLNNELVDALSSGTTANTFINNLNQSWSTLLAAFIIAICVTVFTYQPTNNYSQSNYVAAVVPANLIDLTNVVRSEQKLDTLAINEQLNLAAANKVKAIFANQYFSHTGKNGEKFSSWIKQAGYTNYDIVGENLALGYFDQQTIMNAWMNSPKHKENIVSPLFNEIGMAAATGNYHGKETTIIVQLFGKQTNTVQSESSNTITANIIR